jgi:hypothetical protein
MTITTDPELTGFCSDAEYDAGSSAKPLKLSSGSLNGAANAPPMEATAKVKLAYSVKEFCDETSIGKTMFYELVKTKKIRVTKIGSRSIITGAEATRFLKEGA